MSEANRIKAEADYNRGMKYKDIAHKYGVTLSTVKSWKTRYKWDRKSTRTNEKSMHTKRQGPGPPQGNKNAAGNRGGLGGPAKNDKAATHGLFRRFLPQDPEFLEIADLVERMEPLDMIWHNITMLFQKIIWSERIMFVKDKSDETKVLTKYTEGQFGDSKTWDYQHAWDKLANTIKAQAVAMREHRALVKQFLAVAPETDERRLRLQQMEQGMRIEQEKLVLAKAKLENELKNAGGNTDTGNIDQLTAMLKKSAEAIGGA